MPILVVLPMQTVTGMDKSAFCETNYGITQLRQLDLTIQRDKLLADPGEKKSF